MRQTEGQKIWNDYWGHKPKIKFNKLSAIVFIIILICIGGVRYFSGGGSLFKKSYLDFTTATYIESLMDTEKEIHETIDYIIVQYNANGKINIVNTQIHINDARTSLESTKKIKVKRPYKAYKEEREKELKALIDTLENVNYKSDFEIETIIQIKNSYEHVANITVDSLAKIFDSKGVDYEINNRSDGSTEIRYKYEVYKY